MEVHCLEDEGINAEKKRRRNGVEMQKKRIRQGRESNGESGGETSKII